MKTAHFIELLDKNNRNTLINLDHITSMVIYHNEKEEEEVRVYLTGDKDSFITVKETYSQLRERLSGIVEVSDFR
jgi:hypothetical protein